MPPLWQYFLRLRRCANGLRTPKDETGRTLACDATIGDGAEVISNGRDWPYWPTHARLGERAELKRAGKSQAKGWNQPSRSAPLVQVGIKRLLAQLEANRQVTFTASALAEASGLHPQQASVALVALAAAGVVIPAYDRARHSQVWRSAGHEKAQALPPDRVLTIAEAATLTGRTEKALRRRVERRTLRAQYVGRSVYVSHRALVQAGLTEGSLKRTSTAHGARLIIDLLRQERRGLSTWKASNTGHLPRQTTEIVLAALAAAGLVTRELAGGVAWRWASD
jgi:hypothetical protein